MNQKFKLFEYEVIDGKACIIQCLSEYTTIEIPEKIDGYQVAKIGDYAFSRRNEDVAKLNFTTSQIEELILPKTLQSIGRYAFYNCRNLRRIQFYNSLKDIGAGAFTGCHKVRELDVTFVDNGKSCLRELLTEIPEEQTLFYHSEAGEARLVFPEFFEEAVENTPARMLATYTHGSGMMYRNCFVQQELQFHLYDERFEWARGREYKDTLFRLVFGRLLYPYQLGEQAKEKYMDFLKEQFEECVRWIANGRREKECRFFTAHCVEEESQIELLIQEMRKREMIEMTSYLMEFKHQHFKKKRKTFEL